MGKGNFTITEFNTAFPDDDSVLEYLFKERYGNLRKCPCCKSKAEFQRVKGRKCYYCIHCAFQLHPLSGTIFHKSPTSLKLWFYAIYLFTSSRNGVSAKELERQLGVTYKTAWRMAHQIRKLCNEDQPNFMCETVEADETYYGGKAKGKRGRGAANKTPLFGMVERQGKVFVQATPDTKAATLMPIIVAKVCLGSAMMTDEYGSYNGLSAMGFTHSTVQHSRWQWADGDTHTNTIEGFWGLLKPSMKGTYRYVSPKYLQRYVDEFVFRYNRRDDPRPLFQVLVERGVRPV